MELLRLIKSNKTSLVIAIFYLVVTILQPMVIFMDLFNLSLFLPILSVGLLFYLNIYNSQKINIWYLITLSIILLGDFTCVYSIFYPKDDTILWIIIGSTIVWLSMLLLHSLLNLKHINILKEYIFLFIIVAVSLCLVTYLVTEDTNGFFYAGLVMTLITALNCYITFVLFITSKDTLYLVYFFALMGTFVANAFYGIFEFHNGSVMYIILDIFIYDLVQLPLCLIMTKKMNSTEK